MSKSTPTETPILATLRRGRAYHMMNPANPAATPRLFTKGVTQEVDLATAERLAAHLVDIQQEVRPRVYRCASVRAFEFQNWTPPAYDPQARTVDHSGGAPEVEELSAEDLGLLDLPKA
jgi:hypothetical protein